MPQRPAPLIRPPAQRTQHQIERMARTLEQTMARRRRLLKELRDADQEVRTARKLLREVIADATAPVDHEIVADRPDHRRDDIPSDSPPVDRARSARSRARTRDRSAKPRSPQPRTAQP